MWTLEEEISPIALLLLLPPILYTCAILFGSMAAAAADRYVTLRQSRRTKNSPNFSGLRIGRGSLVRIGGGMAEQKVK